MEAVGIAAVFAFGILWLAGKRRRPETLEEQLWSTVAVRLETRRRT
jgi:hypothetical protein